MRYYSGYMVLGARKANFEVKAASKANALRNLKEDYPDWKIIITESYHSKRKQPYA